MKFYIVIPAHNEENTIASTLESLVNQTLLPKRVVVVNDNSTDDTQKIVEHYVKTYKWIDVVYLNSSIHHIPGSKVINAFYKGLELLDEDYDVICKFDADIILPQNYLEHLKFHFEKDSSVGMVGGLAFIKKDDEWIYENIANKNHIRGPFKSYRKACFENIGGLRPSIGWDTVDVLLAKYYNWKIIVDESLKVKHLKPTGTNYNASAKLVQGEALYKMRYGFVLTLITALKMTVKKSQFRILINYMKGYFKAKSERLEFMVNEDQGKFIRASRWKGIFNKLK